MASVRETSNGRWQARCYVNGKYHSKQVSASSKRAALKQASAWEVKLRESYTTPTTFRQMSERYRQVKEWKPNTQDAKDTRHEYYLLPTLGDLKLERISPVVIDSLLAELRGRGLSPRTVYDVFSELRTTLNQAVKWGYLTTNPCYSVDTPKMGQRELSPPTPSELTRALEEAGRINPMMPLFFGLLAATGVRRGEACALTWERWSGNQIEIRSTVSNTMSSGVQVHTPKTKRSQRMVAIGEEIQLSLTEWLRYLRDGTRDTRQEAGQRGLHLLAGGLLSRRDAGPCRRHREPGLRIQPLDRELQRPGLRPPQAGDGSAADRPRTRASTSTAPPFGS